MSFLTTRTGFYTPHRLPNAQPLYAKQDKNANSKVHFYNTNFSRFVIPQLVWPPQKCIYIFVGKSRGPQVVSSYCHPGA